MSVAFTPPRPVEQHDRRVRDQHVGQLQQLALPVGQRARERAGVLGDPGELEQLQRAPPGSGAASPGEEVPQTAGAAGGAVRDIFADARPRRSCSPSR